MSAQKQQASKQAKTPKPKMSLNTDLIAYTKIISKWNVDNFKMQF